MGSIVTQMMKHFASIGAKLDCSLPKQDIKLDKVLVELPTIPSYMTFLASVSIFLSFFCNKNPNSDFSC